MKSNKTEKSWNVLFKTLHLVIKRRKRVPKRCWRHNDGHPNTNQDKKKQQEASAMKSSLFMTDMIKHFKDSTKNSVHNVTSWLVAKTRQSIVQRYLGLWQKHIGRQYDNTRPVAKTHQSTVRHLSLRQTHQSIGATIYQSLATNRSAVTIYRLVANNTLVGRGTISRHRIP